MGCEVSSRPGFSPSVPTTNSAFLGLMQYSSDFDFVGGVDAVARQEQPNIRRHFFFSGEEGVAEFLLKVAVEIEFGAARVDQNLSGIVVEKEGKMHALGGDLNPLAASVLTFPIPRPGCGSSSRSAG